MDDSKEEYVVTRRQKARGRKKLFILISIVSFLGSTVIAVIPAIQEIYQQENTLQAVSTESILKQQEQDFELVLEREPNNQVALDGLVKVRLQLNDIQGAIEPLEKLVKLNPEREDLIVQLEDLKTKLQK